MHERHPDFEMPDWLTNRIVGSVFWDEINATAERIQLDLDVEILHMVEGFPTRYVIRLTTGDEDTIQIKSTAQIRATEILNSYGWKTIHFRINCRWDDKIGENELIGFDQNGRIVNDYPVVDELTDVFTNKHESLD